MGQLDRIRRLERAAGEHDCPDPCHHSPVLVDYRQAIAPLDPDPAAVPPPARCGTCKGPESAITVVAVLWEAATP